MLTSIHLTSNKNQKDPSLKIAVFGIGALGCLLGARLTPYAHLTLIGTWTEQLQALQTAPLRYVYPTGQTGEIKLNATADLNTISPVDIAIVATKSAKTEIAAQGIVKILKDHGLAITLQNGLGNIEVIAKYVGNSRCTLGITTLGATLESVGVVRYADTGSITIATRPEIESRLTALITTLQQAGLTVETTTHIKPMVWRKLAVNAAINPLTAILRVPNGELLRSEWAKQMMTGIAHEIAELASAQWIPLTYPELIGYIEQVAQQTYYNRSSMLRDIERGAPTEIETICGSLLRLAESVGVAMPITATVYRMVKALESTHINTSPR